MSTRRTGVIAAALALAAILWLLWPAERDPRSTATEPAASSERQAERARARARVQAMLAEARARLQARLAARGPAAGATEDPVGALVPMLAGKPPAEQLAVLRWMRQVPEKLPTVFPDLAMDRSLDQDARQRAARDRVDALIALLVLEGHEAPEPEQAPATISAGPPEPVDMPPSLRADYDPYPGDDEAVQRQRDIAPDAGAGAVSERAP